MASKFIILATLLAACNAVPVWYREYVPGTFVRTGRGPLSYGYGSGFASNIGGITHTTGLSSSYSSDGSSAYSSGVGVIDGGYARGLGLAGAGNSYPTYQVQPRYVVSNPVFTNTVASAQNIGGYNSAASYANTAGGRAVSSAQNIGGYESAYSTVNNGYRSATSSAVNNGYGQGNAISAVRSAGPGYNSEAISASEQDGLYRGSTAQTVEHRGNSVRSSGASSINGPGIQASQSHAVQTGYY